MITCSQETERVVQLGPTPGSYKLSLINNSSARCLPAARRMNLCQCDRDGILDVDHYQLSASSQK